MKTQRSQCCWLIYGNCERYLKCRTREDLELGLIGTKAPCNRSRTCPVVHVMHYVFSNNKEDFGDSAYSSADKMNTGSWLGTDTCHEDHPLSLILTTNMVEWEK